MEICIVYYIYNLIISRWNQLIWIPEYGTILYRIENQFILLLFSCVFL